MQYRYGKDIRIERKSSVKFSFQKKALEPPPKFAHHPWSGAILFYSTISPINHVSVIERGDDIVACGKIALRIYTAVSVAVAYRGNKICLLRQETRCQSIVPLLFGSYFEWQFNHFSIIFSTIILANLKN